MSERTVPDGPMQDLIYLCRCAVSGESAEKARAEKMDLRAVYREAERHTLTAVAAYALAGAGVRNPAFLWARERAARKTALMDREQARITERLEAAGIRYMPMKGAVLKDLYPARGIREMADRDIFIDEARAADVRRIMEELGYKTDTFDEEYHDCYRKGTECTFEMHRHLMGPMSGKAMYAYYLKAEKALAGDGEDTCACRLGDGDFYLFLVAHEYRHYAGEGTGLRSLLDTYVALTRLKPDLKAVRAEARKLGIAEFEELNRSLALHLFGGGTLTEAERSLLDYLADCGTYGKEENFAKNLLAQEGRRGYFRSRLTLPYARMLEMYPALRRHPAAYPFCWTHRLVHALIHKNAKVRAQLKAGLALKGSGFPRGADVCHGAETVVQYGRKKTERTERAKNGGSGAGSPDSLKRRCLEGLRLTERDVTALRLAAARQPSPRALFSFFETAGLEDRDSQQACALAAACRRTGGQGVPADLLPRLQGVVRYHTVRNPLEGQALAGMLAALGPAGTDVMLLGGEAMALLRPQDTVRRTGIFRLRMTCRRPADAARALKEAGGYTVRTGKRSLFVQKQDKPGLLLRCRIDCAAGDSAEARLLREDAAEGDFRGERVLLPGREALLCCLLADTYEAALRWEEPPAGRLQWAIDCAAMIGDEGFRWDRLRALCAGTGRAAEAAVMLEILDGVLPGLIPEGEPAAMAAGAAKPGRTARRMLKWMREKA